MGVSRITDEEKTRKINPYGQTAILNAINIDLEKENAELKAQIEQLSNDNHVLKTSFIIQQEQIEKMKCCGNCKHYEIHTTKEGVKYCLTCRQLDENKEKIIYPKWEMYE